MGLQMQYPQYNPYKFLGRLDECIHIREHQEQFHLI